MKLIEDVVSKGTFGFILNSADEESDHTKLHLIGFGRWKVYQLKHTWLKPLVIKHKATSRDTLFDVPLKRSISIQYTGEDMNFFYFKFGAENPGWLDEYKGKDNYWIWNIPWKHSTFIDHQLLQLDKSHLHTMQREDNFFPDGYPEHESIIFTFTDGYDGEVINAKCRVEKRRWHTGIGWFKWLRYFTKEQVSIDLDIKFNHEVGKRKGSWKGGTIGHGIQIHDNENPIQAFKRYCSTHGHKYIGVQDE